jgi:hypothetical protein
MPHEEALIPSFIPALVAILYKAEQTYGQPLTREQVLAIRDASNVVMLPRDLVAKTAADRGYEDLDPKLAWEQWQEARKELRPLGGEA